MQAAGRPWLLLGRSPVLGDRNTAQMLHRDLSGTRRECATKEVQAGLPQDMWACGCHILGCLTGFPVLKSTRLSYDSLGKKGNLDHMKSLSIFLFKGWRSLTTTKHIKLLCVLP